LKTQNVGYTRVARLLAPLVTGLLVAGLSVTAVAQDDAIPETAPTSVEDEIAYAGRTSDTSFCGEEPMLLGIHDGIGVNAWSEASFAAARSEAAKCPNVETIVAGALFDLQKANSDINAWVAQGVDAIVIIPDAGGPGAQLQPLQDATAQGVVVVPWGSDPAGEEGVDYLTYVDWDSVDAGRIWARWMAEAVSGAGKLVVLGGPAGVAVGLDQLEGMNEVFAEYPDIELMTGTDDYAVTNWDPQVAQETMTALLGQFPEIDGVITNYGTDAVGVIRAFEAAGRELVPMTSLEANQLACEFAELKEANPRYELATISSRNWLGRVAVRKAIAAVQGIENSEPSTYPLPLFEDTLGGLDPVCDPSLAPDQYLSNQISAEELEQYGVPE
jgi:ribose transport system substrate-binding protein